MKSTLNLYTNNYYELIETLTFDTLEEALNEAEYYYNNYGYNATVLDSGGDIYAEYEN